VVELSVARHELFTYAEYAELRALLEALAGRLDVPLVLVDGKTGMIIADTGVDKEWFAKHWLFIKDKLNSLPAWLAKSFTYDNQPILCSRYSVANLELALLTARPKLEQPVSSPNVQDFELIQHLLWQYLQGQVSAYYESNFVALIEKAQLPSQPLSSGDYYHHIVEVAATIPGAVMATVRALTSIGTGRLVARIGEYPQDMPEELPVAGVWGKCLEDGQVRMLAKMAEDPGISSHLLQRLEAYSSVYLPLGLGGKTVAVLIMAFDKWERLQTPHIRELLTWVNRWGSLLATMAHSTEDLVWAKRQLWGQTHLIDSLAEGNIQSLADMEDMISVLWGLSWVRISLEEGIDQDISELVRIPLQSADTVIGYLYARRGEIAALGKDLLHLGIVFLSHCIYLWRELADRSHTSKNGFDTLLTPRELEVAQLIAQGESNKTAAARLGLSEKTIKTHISNMLRKLNLPDRTAIAVWYTKNQS